MADGGNGYLSNIATIKADMLIARVMELRTIRALVMSLVLADSLNPILIACSICQAVSAVSICAFSAGSCGFDMRLKWSSKQSLRLRLSWSKAAALATSDTICDPSVCSILVWWSKAAALAASDPICDPSVCSILVWWSKAAALAASEYYL